MKYKRLIGLYNLASIVDNTGWYKIELVVHLVQMTKKKKQRVIQ